MNYKVVIAPEFSKEAADRPLTKSEQVIYNHLKRSLKQIKLHQEGKIKLPQSKKY